MVLVVSTITALTGILFLTGRLDNEFNRRLDQIPDTIEVTSSTSTIDEHCNWASDFTGERASESTDRITWQHIPIQCHSWKEFNGFLEEKISSEEFIGDEIFFNEDTKTIWFDSFQYRKTQDGKKEIILFLNLTSWVVEEIVGFGVK